MFQPCKVIDPSRSSQIKSKIAPHLKINCMVYRLTVENFMHLSQFAQFLNFKEPLTTILTCASFRASSLISSSGLIIMTHTSPYLCCLSSCTYNSHLIKKRKFHSVRYTHSQFQTVSTGCPPFKPHTFSARLLFEETFAQPDVFELLTAL